MAEPPEQQLVPVDDQAFLRLFARLVHHRHAALFTKGRIRQHHIVFAVLAGQRVLRRHGQCGTAILAVFLFTHRLKACVTFSDAVQQQVHRSEPRHAVHQFDAKERAVLEPLLLRLVQTGRARDVIMRRQQKPARGSQIVNARPASEPGCGATTSTIAVMSGRGVKYWPAPPFTSSAFFCSSPS